MKQISPTLHILKKAIRYFISISAISQPILATNLYISLDGTRNIKAREYPTLSSAQKYQCLEGISNLSRKIALANKKHDSIPTSFVDSKHAIAFPAENGGIIIVKKEFPFEAKKFSPPKDQGIYEFSYNKDSFAFTINGTKKCASTKPISECGNLKPQVRSILSSSVNDSEISKYIYSSISELKEVLKRTRKEDPSFSYLSTEMKVCIDAFKIPEKITHTNDFQKTLRLLDPSDFYAGGVGGVGGGPSPVSPSSRAIGSESEVLKN